MRSDINLIHSDSVNPTIDVIPDKFCPSDKIYFTFGDEKSYSYMIDNARRDEESLKSSIKSYERSFLKRLHFLLTGEFLG